VVLNLFGLLSILTTALIGCTSASYRGPAQSFPKYSYTKSFECKGAPTFDARNKTEWSSLSGHMVGPTQTKFKGNSDEKILRPFTSDGCSSSPDGFETKDKNPAWVDCCITHDTAYWLDGT
jgi:hypothetical protein